MIIRSLIRNSRGQKLVDIFSALKEKKSQERRDGLHVRLLGVVAEELSAGLSTSMVVHDLSFQFQGIF